MKSYDKYLNIEMAMPDLKLRRYLIADDDKLWRRPNKYRVVNSFLVGHWQLYRGSIIFRKFYVAQYWHMHTKQLAIVEVMRYVSGCDRKAVWGLTSSMGGGAYVSSWRNRYSLAKFESYDLEYNYRRFDSNRLSDIDLSKSRYRYIKAQLKAMDPREEHYIFRVMSKYDKYPDQVEWLMKSGATNVVLSGERLRWTKKGYEILGLKNKHEFNLYKKSGIPLKDFKANKGEIFKYSIDSIRKFYALEHSKELVNEHGFKLSSKLINYVNEHNYTSYRDYLKALKDIGETHIDSKMKYPEDLTFAHDIATAKVNVARDEITCRKFKDQFDKFKELAYFNEELIIRPVKSPDELIVESAKLSHCVKTYAERVTKGETEIFFIRSKDAANEPFVTLELMRNEIMQCRGDHNSAPPKYVKQFISDWANKFKLNQERLKL